MDFKIFTLKITGKRTGTKTRKRRTRESEAEDSSVSSKDQLRARVYSLLREVAHVLSLLLLDLRSLILSLRLLVVWFRKNLILLVLFLNLIMPTSVDVIDLVR
jgi:hypothetical protein